MSKFDGYSVNLFLDDDGEWLAHFIEMPNISAFGESPEKALKELETAWNAIKESYVKNGESVPIAPSKRQYSGQFNIRIDKRIHRELAIEASRVGISLNALVAQKLAQSSKNISID
jgi:predicted HicB family RNase H-like nuclease